MAIAGVSPDGWTWHDPANAPFRLAGFPWFAKDRVFFRLPLHPAEKIRAEVSELANCTAGGQVAFQSNARKLAVRVELVGAHYMYHMPATGQCGFDLYLGMPPDLRFHAVTRFDVKLASYEAQLFEHPVPAWRNFTLNFPLYQGVKNLRIGLPPDAGVRSPVAWVDERPVVVYGTSITQGGCASRPGLAYTNIVSRALNRQVVNLGFSGNGRGDPEVLRIMVEIKNPALLVLDYEANAGGLAEFSATLPAAISILRTAHPNTPLLVQSRIPFANDYSHEGALPAREKRMQMQRDLVAQLRERGDRNLHFVDGGALLGEDADECTVDGLHPNDIGFMRMARALAKVWRSLIAGHASNEKN